MLLLAALPPSSPPLVCTIDTVQSQWSPHLIPGVRVLKGQMFRLQIGPSLTVEPRYVIDSRLTTLADDLQPPHGSTAIDGTIRYRWTFEAPLGLVALDSDAGALAQESLARVQGLLTLQPDRSFQLVNRSVITARRDGAQLTRLDEKASGRCHERG